jgi:predicted nucleic acid-binding Zn ribbon protein
MRDILTSPRDIEIKRTRRIKKIRLFVIFFLIFILIIGTLSFFSGDKHVVIDKVVVSGNQIIDSKDIEDEVYKNISGKYIYLFSKANSFIFPHSKIYDSLILDFPRIEKLSMRKDGLKTIHIDITERVGSYLYCGASIPENKDDVGENCYFMNNNGYIFDKAPYFSGNVYFKYYMAINGVENPLGDRC